jgi:hypothetical protein
MDKNNEIITCNLPNAGKDILKLKDHLEGDKFYRR